MPATPSRVIFCVLTQAIVACAREKRRNNPNIMTMAGLLAPCRVIIEFRWTARYSFTYSTVVGQWRSLQGCQESGADGTSVLDGWKKKI